MVRLIGGHAEHAQRGVALELVDPATFLLDPLDDDPEERVQQADDGIRRTRLREPARADEVDEHHARLAALAAEMDALLAREIGDLHTDVPAEQVLERSPVAQAADHAIEARLELPDLAAVVDGDVDVELVALHPASAARISPSGSLIDRAAVAMTTAPTAIPTATNAQIATWFGASSGRRPT